MRQNPRPQEIYRHFKGNLYQIRCLARNSETMEWMVVYQAMYDTFEIYVRPLSMFMDEVDRNKYPDCKQRFRFELLEDLSDLGAVAGEYRNDANADIEERHVTAEEVTEKYDDGNNQTADVQASEQEQVATEEGLHKTELKENNPSAQCEPEEQLNIDPMVLEFLDADTYEQRLNILSALHNRITDEMINTMAVAVDLEIREGDIERRYEELKNCLLTFEKYECNRLR